MNRYINDLIHHLGLQPHPEGGWYREYWRDPQSVPTSRGERSASTAIYYLLEAGRHSALHRIPQAEVWHHYAGGALRIPVLDARDGCDCLLLGADRAAGQQLVQVVPGGHWFGAEPVAGWALVGCTVAPGFDFADFELAGPEDLGANQLRNWGHLLAVTA